MFVTLDEAHRLANSLLKEHGLADWTFKFDRAKRRFGCCNYSTHTISLSRDLTRLNSKAEVRDTLLHEIAHALTRGNGHGPAWRAKCLELGARPERYYASKVAQPAPNYLLECPSCDLQVPRMRRSKRALYCRRCYERQGAVDEAFRLRFRTLRGSS